MARVSCVDVFGKSKIYKSLLFSYRAVLAGPTKVSVRSETEDSAVDEFALSPPTDSKRKILEKSVSRSATSSLVGKFVPGPSNC